MLVHVSADCWRVILGWLTLTDLLRVREASHATQARLGDGWAYVRVDLDLRRSFYGIRSVAGAQRMLAAYPSSAGDGGYVLGAALEEACCRGWLSKARWLVAHVRRFPSAWNPADRGLLEAACRGGHAATARWVAVHFGLSARRRGSSRGALAAACHGGHLRVAQWLVTHFELNDASAHNSADPVHDDAFAALCAACRGGQLAVAQWLTTVFRLLGTFNFDNLLREVCAAGHLAVVQWMVVRFGISPPNAGWRLSAVDSASTNGHLALAGWLTQHWRDKNAP
jgi:hypothetical protein